MVSMLVFISGWSKRKVERESYFCILSTSTVRCTSAKLLYLNMIYIGFFKRAGLKELLFKIRNKSKDTSKGYDVR